MALRAAVVGSGPAGFFTCEALLKHDFAVDLYDALPTPFGLVRAGVAPDHPKIKTVTRRYETVAQHPGFRFFGGVEVGADVSREALLARYHAVVYAVGAHDDNRLGVPGEHRPGSHAATEFVAWYNGHPGQADREFDLSARTAVVVGNGNVALDVARMLVLDPAEVARTDAADHAVAALARGQVERVIVLGRRGPAQAAFTTPELLELAELPHADVVVELGAVEPVDNALVRKKVEFLQDLARRPPTGWPRRIELRFLGSPLEILGDGPDGPVTGLRIARTRLDAGGRALATGEEELIECGLVLRSIGYRGRALPGLPFDARRGVIRNAGGRVTADDGTPLPGEYTAGWIKRGASGVIGTNKKCAAETVARLLEDAAAGRLNPATEPATEPWPGVVTWAGWQAIDAHELAAGVPQRRPRVKLVRVSDMLAIAAARA